MEGVGAATRSHVDGCAGRPAILGALIIGHYVEVCDGVGRDGDDLVVESLVALAVGVVVHAVEQEVIKHAALPVYVVRSLAHQAADRARRCLCRRLARTGDQGEKVGEVAAYQRQRLCLIARDGLAALAGSCFDLQRDIAHLDRGGGGLANVKGEIDALPRSHGDADVLRLGRRETGRFGFDGVNADVERGDFVVARVAGDNLGDDAGVDVGDGDTRIGHDRTRTIMDGADQAPILILGVCPGATDCDQQAKKDNKALEDLFRAHRRSLESGIQGIVNRR